GGAGAPLLSLAHPTRVDLRLEQGRVDTAGIAVLLSLQDITHEREVERLKSEFLSTAAHELRTPMVSVHGFTELLLQRALPAERQRSMLEAIHRNSTQMNHIVDELLDLARIEARGDRDFQRVTVRLCDLLHETVPDFQPPAGRSAVSIEGDDGGSAVWADPAKLRQVLFNLISNAYKYSQAPGGVTLRLLRTAVAEGPERVGFEVEDQGIGMTPEQQARVFERFYRADPSGQVLGSGLGMAIVHEIVHLHGGEVSVRSQPGRGTTVAVWLPVTADQEVPRCAPEMLA
ncbi:MAG: HAMP domain-containing histidine kinase, partial [Burkholderiales bacterium]|nr:HAMP domain-containing histidine kinase [Burkholderiales bacterium]